MTNIVPEVYEGFSDGEAAAEGEPVTETLDDEEAEGMVQLALEEAPMGDDVPIGQGIAFTEESGQYEPGGQIMGAPEEQK